MTKTTHTTLYKDKSCGKIMGVCAGLADYTGVNAFWIRLGAFLSLFVLGPLSVLVYILMGIFLSQKPAHLYQDKQEQQYWQGVRQNPRRSVREVKARFRDIDRRLADVESFYVSSNPRLSDEIERLR